MSKKFEKIAEKWKKAKDGNKIVDLVKEGVSKDVAEETFGLLNDLHVDLYPRQKSEIAAYVSKFGGPADLAEQYFKEAHDSLSDDGDFNELIILGECLAFAGQNEKAVSTFEKAFELMEDDSDYLFHAMNAIEVITLGEDIENPDGCWYVSVPNKEYLVSTLNSVFEDFEAAIDNVDEDDQVRYYSIFAKCYARIGDSENSGNCFSKAFSCAEETFDYLQSLFYDAELETPALPQGGVSDDAEMVPLASEDYRAKVLKQAEVQAKTDDDKEQLGYMKD